MAIRIFKTYKSGPRWNVYLQVIRPVVPSEWCGEELCVLLNTSVPSKSRTVGIDDAWGCSSLFYTNSVICEDVAGVEVENPQQACSLKYDDLVAFVFEGD